MAEVVVEIPEELAAGFELLGKAEAGSIVSSALREHLSERLMFKLADELLKDSDITCEMALQWGSELKEGVAKRHGL